MRRKDQQRALQHLREDPGLRWSLHPLLQHMCLLLLLSMGSNTWEVALTC